MEKITDKTQDSRQFPDGARFVVEMAAVLRVATTGPLTSVTLSLRFRGLDQPSVSVSICRGAEPRSYPIPANYES